MPAYISTEKCSIQFSHFLSYNFKFRYDLCILVYEYKQTNMAINCKCSICYFLKKILKKYMLLLATLSFYCTLTIAKNKKKKVY